MAETGPGKLPERISGHLWGSLSNGSVTRLQLLMEVARDTTVTTYDVSGRPHALCGCNS
jgi:hypothetical protein